MKDIVITGLSERFLLKLVRNVDEVNFGYSNIPGIILNPVSINKTNIIFIDNEQYNRTYPCSIEYIFELLSKE